MTVSSAVAQYRSQLPGQFFRDLGGLLAVPELSVQSPWLNRSPSEQLTRGISDAAYEALPHELLPRLRPDPVGTASFDGDQLRLTFTGFDAYSLVLETSPDLRRWTPVETNSVADRSVTFSRVPAGASGHWFYRAVLAP